MATTKTGSLGISDLLAARFQTVVEFGEDRIQQVLANDVAAHNRIMLDLVSAFCEVTGDRHRRYGSSIGGEMVEVDEHGRAPTQRDRPGATVGFPLSLYQFNLGWTNTFLKSATPADLAIATQAAQKGHRRQVTRQIKRAIYLSANYSHRDHLIDEVDLDVKRLLNADGDPIPEGPNGEVFDGATHTHFNAASSLTNSVGLALIDDVVEHGHGDGVTIAINRADEAAWRALSSFTAYQDPRVTLNANANEAVRRLDIARLDNRAIGIFGAAEVWVKPWAIAGYAFCYATGGPDKPLAFRQRQQSALQGLRLASQFEMHPLIAEFYEAEFGVGVWTRTKGAVLYHGAASYTDPQI